MRFDDIGGYEEVKEELQQALDLMRRRQYGLPGKIAARTDPARVYLFGPPGTGRTLFAKAVANQLDATIQVVSGPEVTDMYVGEGERKVRELFAEAHRNAPAVLVFDEFDSIAQKRSGRDDGGSRAGDAVFVAQILTEMDGFRPSCHAGHRHHEQVGTNRRRTDAPSRFKAIAIDLPNPTAAPPDCGRPRGASACNSSMNCSM